MKEYLEIRNRLAGLLPDMNVELFEYAESGYFIDIECSPEKAEELIKRLEGAK